MTLLSKIPERFKDLNVRRARELSDVDKLEVFFDCKYPDSTWWFHNVIGARNHLKFQDSDKLKFMKHLTEQDLYYFSKWIMGKNLLREEPNREMSEKVMSRHWPDRQERKMLLEPRGTYKSTISSVSFPVWSLAKNRNLCVLIYSETDSQASKFYQACKNAMESNSLLQRIWGQFRSGMWNETRLNVTGREDESKPDPSLCHAGLDSSVNGAHPDIACIDDLCSEQNTQNADQLDKAYAQYQLLTPLVNRAGLIQIVATRWVKDDPPERILRNEKDFFSEISVKSAEDRLANGKLYGEDIGLDEDFLRRTRISMGNYRYSANYLNEPRPDEESSFQVGWVKQFDTPFPVDMDETGEERPLPLAVYVSVDSSWADKGSTGKDPTAIIAAGIDFRGHIWMLEIFNKRVPPNEVVDKVFEMVQKWNPMELVTEDVGTQKGVNKMLEEQMVTRRIIFRMNKVRHQSQSKSGRIMGMQGLFQSGAVHCRPEDKDFLNQVQTFSPGHRLDHDDILDALEMIYAEYYSISQPQKTEAEIEEEMNEDFPIYDEITGRM